uniref:hypothetical protein n=1 Tax=Pararhizobium sp. IMCC3301 TaxID=3067904 RepID=UPI002740DBA9|nr:hypothetical protein [Pararhizobium sp. IMCC3301]
MDGDTSETYQRDTRDTPEMGSAQLYRPETLELTLILPAPVSVASHTARLHAMADAMVAVTRPSPALPGPVEQAGEQAGRTG